MSEQGLLEHLPRPRAARAEPSPRYDDPLRKGTRALLVVFVMFTLLAVNQLLVLGGQTDRFFAWTIASRPSSAFLGAAYGVGALLSVLALRQGRWGHVRVAVITVTAFTVLTLVPTLIHRHRLHLGETGVARTAAVVWLAVYVAVPVFGALVVVRQERSRRLLPGQVRRPLPARLVTVLVAQGGALTAMGAVLYAGGFRSHEAWAVPRPGWPWPVTPLTSQVIGAWLLSFGIAIVLAVRERDANRLIVPALAYATFGLVEVAVLLCHRGAAGADPFWLWADAALFATLVPVGVYGAWVTRERRLAAGP